MATTTSLLRGAASTRAQLAKFQDQVAAHQYSISAKTYNDFVDYQRYLQDRMDSSVSQIDKFGYAKTIQDARKAYTTNEIQRSNIDIIEGRGTSTEKYNKMVDLFNQAIDMGDYDSAQGLRLQLDTLSVKIQNEQEAASKTAATLAMNGVKSVGELISKVKKGQDFIELADGSVIKPIPMLESEMRANGDTQNGFFEELRKTVEGLRGTVIDAYQSATTQEAVDSIEQKYGGLITGDYNFNVAGTSLSLQDIEVAAKSNAANNPIYDVQSSFDEATGAQKFKLVKNKIDNFIWIRNDDGSYSAIQERTKVASKTQTLDTKLTDDGFVIGKDGQIGNGSALDKSKIDKSQTIGARLTAQGITAQQNNDGTLNLVLADGTEVTGTIEPDGNIRYAGAPGKYSGSGAGVYEVNILNGQTREVAPDETSDFGVSSQFGGMLSKASELGKNYVKQYLHPDFSKYTPVDLSHAMVGISPDVSGASTPLVGSNIQGTSSVLQGGQNTRERLAAEASKREAALRSSAQLAQAATNFNLNQIPVRQFAQNGAPVRQLTVAPVVTPTINKVDVARPKQKIVSTGTSNQGYGIGDITGSMLQGESSVGLF